MWAKEERELAFLENTVTCVFLPAVMEFFRILCLFCAVIAGVNGLQEKGENEVERELNDALDKLRLAEKLENDNSTREARGLLKKLSFLAGMQVGGLLQSSGTLAASNSVRIFGKVVNSALSVSYGSLNQVGQLPGVGIQPIGQVVENDSQGQTVKDDGIPPPATATTIVQRVGNGVKELLNDHNQFVSRVNNKYLRSGH